MNFSTFLAAVCGKIFHFKESLQFHFRHVQVLISALHCFHLQYPRIGHEQSREAFFDLSTRKSDTTTGKADKLIQKLYVDTNGIFRCSF